MLLSCSLGRLLLVAVASSCLGTFSNAAKAKPAYQTTMIAPGLMFAHYAPVGPRTSVAESLKFLQDLRAAILRWASNNPSVVEVTK